MSTVAAARATLAPVSFPVSDLDRMSGSERIVYVAGPLAVPPRQQLVDNLLAAAELGPQSRVGLTLNSAGDTWTYDPSALRGVCEAIVDEIPPIAESEVVDVLRSRIQDEPTPAPLRITVAGDFVILRMNHMLGDINILIALFGVAMAAPGRPIPAWIAKDQATNPLALAVRETFVKHPARVVDVVRSQRSRLGAAPDPARADSATVPWQRSAEAAYARGTMATARKLKTWIHATPGSASVATAILVAVRRALVAEGIAVQGASSVVYDSRRYLPDGVVTTGNFIGGLPVPSGLSDSPRLVSDVIKANLAAASPLAGMLVGVGRSRLRGRRPAAAPTSVAARPAAHVVLTNFGVQRELDQVPWTVAKGDEQFAVWAEPSAPDDLVVGILQLRGALHITAFFHGNVFDVDRVQAALDRVTSDPVSLLEEH